MTSSNLHSPNSRGQLSLNHPSVCLLSSLAVAVGRVRAAPCSGLRIRRHVAPSTGNSIASRPGGGGITYRDTTRCHMLSRSTSLTVPYTRSGSGQVTGPAAAGMGAGSGSRALIRVMFLRDEPRHDPVAQERRPLCVETLVPLQRPTDLPIAVHEGILALSEQRDVCVSHAREARINADEDAPALALGHFGVAVREGNAEGGCRAILQPRSSGLSGMVRWSASGQKKAISRSTRFVCLSRATCVSGGVGGLWASSRHTLRTGLRAVSPAQT
ncbi:hypothetical protein BN1723_009998 [Verticillium longisporum]|uniref:Uncharacterized protein n=1 Tax=Verticillium longisporum TaxID=100787 RepID=A0A0G4KUD5_VERLO|nr:hypothetical protein BN1723_009998 [Verticillium longisporum]CRK40513.1 hypothetical protein BN1708_008241 [Verticillium longisporum]